MVWGPTAERAELAPLVVTKFSRVRALDSATEITRFYRSPGASGYHRATDSAADLFRANGLDRVWSERFLLDGEAQILSQTMPARDERKWGVRTKYAGPILISHFRLSGK